MKTDVNYKYVKIKYAPYTPEKKKRPITKLLQRVEKDFIKCKDRTKEAKETIFSYNKERCRLAPVIYNIAKCARRITEGKGELKGIAMDFQKEKFCTDNLKELHDKIVDLHSYFEKKRYSTIIASTSIAIFSALAILGGIYPAIISKHGVLILVAFILLFFAFAFIIILPLTICLASIDITYERRLKNLLNDKCIECFDSMYERLEAKGKDKEKFLYDIKDEDLDKQDMAYHFAGLIYKANEKRSYEKREYPSDEPLLATL